MGAIARSELIQLFRNRTVLATAILVPAAMAVMFVAVRANYGGTAAVAAMIVIFIAGFGVYVTATTTLAARRQNLFLKRLRSTAVSDPGILAGLTLPLVAVNVVQLAIIIGALIWVGGPPAQPVVFIAAVVAVEALYLAFALATAGVTTSPEHAQVTTLPLFFVMIGVQLWITFTGTADQALVKRLLPGGAATELLIGSWQGASLADVATLLGLSCAWAGIGTALAAHFFRWEPRRG